MRDLLLKVFCVLSAAALLFGCGGDDDDSSSDDAATGDDSVTADDTQSTDDAVDDIADDSGDDTTAPSYPEACEDGPEFVFDIQSTPFVVPYPNNLYTISNPSAPTGLRVNIREDVTRPLLYVAKFFSWWIDALNTLDGFTTLGYMFVPIGDEPKASDLPDEVSPGTGDGVFLVVIDPESPYFGEFAPIQTHWKKQSLMLIPWMPLHQQTRYAIVATRALHPKEQSCYRASPGMQKIYLDYTANTPPESWTGTRYMEVLDTLAGLGVNPVDILSISEFTTLSVTKGLDDARAILDDLEQQNPPQVGEWTFEGGGSPALDGYAKTILSTPIFKSAETGAWTYDGEGNLQVDHWEDVNVLLSRPAVDAYAGGPPYPVIVYGHGILDTKNSLRSFAPYFANKGFAVIAIDAVCHGERYQGPDYGDDSLNEGLCFYDILRPLSFRDNWRETVTGYMWLTRAVKTLGALDLNGDEIPDLDVEHIYYLGHSMGTIMGGIFAAVEANIETYSMNSAGGDFASIAFDGPVVGPYLDIIESIETLIPGIKAMDLVNDVGALAQHLLDQADPVNYLNHTQYDKIPALEGHTINILQVGMAYDATLGGDSGGYYCRSGGWPQLTPYVWDVGASHEAAPYVGTGFYQYDSDEHNAFFYSGELTDALRLQESHYLRTAYDTGTPEIIDPYAP